MENLLTNIGTIGDAVGWALVHFIWQGALLFFAYWILTRIIFKDKINLHYWLGMLFIVLCLIIPVREFFIQLSFSSPNSSVLHQLALVIPAVEPQGILSPTEIIINLIQKVLPYLVMLWMFSIFLISTNLIKSWFDLVKLSRYSSQKLPKNLQTLLLQASKQLKIRFKPLVTISEKIDIPATFGYLKPVILLPASIINQLPQEQMEVILLHELCHIKRADFLHNILQLIVETLFFYHPLAKWISRDVRATREKCCDAMVIKLKTNPMTYAKALTNIASIYHNDKLNNHSKSYLQIAATDGELFNRIKFLMLEKQSQSSRTNLLFGLVLVSAVLFSLNGFIKNNKPTTHFFQMANTAATEPFLEKSTRPSYELPDIQELSQKAQSAHAQVHKQKQKQIQIQIQQAQIAKQQATIQAQQKKLVQTKPIVVQTRPIQQVTANLPREEIVEKTAENKVTNTAITGKQTKTTKPASSHTYPKLIKRVNPVYSAKARSYGIEGTVILSFNINKNGRVKNIKVDKSSPLKLLDGNARRALHNWRFDKKSINNDTLHNRYQQIFSFYLNGTEECSSSDIGSRLNSQSCDNL